MRTIITICALALLLSGCSGLTNNLGDGRMQAWKEVRVAEEKTSQEFLKTKAVEITSKKNVKQNPTLRLKSYDATGQLVGEAEMDLQPMFAELGLKKDADTYGVLLQKTEQPKGQIAETFDSAGNAVVGVASSPGGLVAATAYGVSRGIKESGGGGTHVTAKEMQIDGSFNKADARAIGGDAKASVGGGATAATEDEEMTLEEAFAECTADGEPLGDAMTCVSAKTGRLVDLNGSTVEVDGEPWPLMQTYGQAQIDAQNEGVE